VSKPKLIAEHYVQLDKLRSPANILDLGCRGFEFTNYFDQRGDYVLPVDMDDRLLKDRKYLTLAISDYNGVTGIRRTNDPQATSMKIDTHGEVVNVATLEALSAEVKVPYWDLIKIDVEGSEYQIIMSLKEALAQQISVEFHLHTGIYTQYHVDQMVNKLLSLGYKIVVHELTNQHGAGFNYWSSLFIRE